MKIKDLEILELRERILKQKSLELFEKAEDIWKKDVNFNSFSKWKKFCFSPCREPHFSEIKEIQMILLDKEVEEAINDNIK